MIVQANTSRRLKDVLGTITSYLYKRLFQIGCPRYNINQSGSWIALRGTLHVMHRLIASFYRNSILHFPRSNHVQSFFTEPVYGFLTKPMSDPYFVSPCSSRCPRLPVYLQRSACVIPGSTRSRTTISTSVPNLEELVLRPDHRNDNQKELFLPLPDEKGFPEDI